MRRFAILATAATAATLALGLFGCEQWIDRILDAHKPDEPAAIQPDSVRGDTTFYSYMFRVTRYHMGWMGPADGSVNVIRVREGYWYLKDAYLGTTLELENVPVFNRFWLVCAAVDSVTSEATCQRAYVAIERAGATIRTHLRPNEQPAWYPGAELFEAYHPAAEHDAGLPASVDLMRFIQALDDTSAFDAVYPFVAVWPD